MFSLKYSISEILVISDTDKREWLEAHWFKNLNPSLPIPWKAYGEVLGLNAPPRKPLAPLRFTAWAIVFKDSLSSTAQGPAQINNGLFPPILILRIDITLSFGWFTRETNLYEETSTYS